jgi:flagellar M-ring protein FliF
MLDKLVGPGHSVTRVDAALNFDKQTIDKQEYISDKANPPLKDSTTKETYTGAGTPVGGVLGPDNIAVPSGTGGAKSSYVKEEQTRDNAVGTQKTTTTTATGQPSRVTVAVVLDQAVAGSLDTAQLTSLVTSAAGLDTTRGDVVTISTMPFDTKAAAQAKKELDTAAAATQQADLINMGKTGGLILLIAMALFVAVKKGRRVERTPVDIGELTVLRGQHALEASAGSLRVESALSPAPAIAQAEAQATSRREIGQLIEQQPDEVAQLLRGWLAERRS